MVHQVLYLQHGFRKENTHRESLPRPTNVLEVWLACQQHPGACQVGPETCWVRNSRWRPRTQQLENLLEDSHFCSPLRATDIEFCLTLHNLPGQDLLLESIRGSQVDVEWLARLDADRCLGSCPRSLCQQAQLGGPGSELAATPAFPMWIEV